MIPRAFTLGRAGLMLDIEAMIALTVIFNPA